MRPSGFEAGCTYVGSQNGLIAYNGNVTEFGLEFLIFGHSRFP